MTTEVFALINFVFTSVLAFMMYRHYVLGSFENQKKNEEIHQEIRNVHESLDRRIDETEDAIWRNVDQLHETVYKIQDGQPKKSTKGINSRIPF